MTFQSINPATGELFAEYAPHTDAVVNERLQNATAAFHTWKNTSFQTRAALFRELATHLRAAKNAFAYTMSIEMGKPITQAKSEVEKCAWVCEYFADEAPNALLPQHIPTEASTSQILFEPLGPILAVMPWNFPFWQLFRFAAPALMAGNVALLKHASNVSGCATHINDLFTRAGFPDHVFQKLFIDHDQTDRIIRDDRLRAVTLTGSTRAGRSVARAAGEALKPCVLELGGSDPFIVLNDADLDRAAQKGVFARMMNNGQSCIAAKRFFLHRDIADAFTQQFINHARALNIGDPTDESTELGPMARGDLRDELHLQVQASLNRGATALLGCEPLDQPGFFYPPSVLGNVRPGMPAFDEELFGPVAAFITVDSVDEAIALANQSAYGLGASLWTSPDRGKELAPRLQSGAVSVNEIVKSDPRLPFGGIKDSGFGRELSHFGLLEFVNIKSLWID